MELARNLKVECVNRLQPGPYVCLRLDATVADAVEQMRRHRVGCVLVCRANGTLAGIFTERDLLRRVLAVAGPLDQPLENCMTPNPAVARPSEPIGQAV